MSTFSNTEIIVPDGPFPDQYLPAAAFWVGALVASRLKYTAAGNIREAAAYGSFQGANTLQGVTLGLRSATYVASQKQTLRWDFANQDISPLICYCVGSIIKQNVYVKFTVASGDNLSFEPIYSSTGIELAQNCKLKKIYVHHGEVVSYRKTQDPEEKLLTLDIGQKVLPYGATIPSTKVKIIRKDGTTSDITITGAKPNWELIVTIADEDFIPRAGDFYEFQGDPWCIEDPLLIDGKIWYGSQPYPKDHVAPSFPSYFTDNQTPYEEGKVLGTYTWIDKDGKALVVDSSVSMQDVEGSEWAWTSLEILDDPTYDKNRYKITTNETTDLTDFSTVTSSINVSVKAPRKYKIRKTTTSKIENPTHIRLDISTGGSRTRQNWYASCLKGEYIKVDSNYYKILDHIEAGIIDVSTTSIDGKAKIGTPSSYSIFHHKAWMVVEHYMNRSYYSDFNGVFEGKVADASFNSEDKTTTLKLKGVQDDINLWKNFNSRHEIDGISENNFRNRYVLTYSGDGPKKVYSKYQHWKLVFDKVFWGQKDQMFSIKSVTFPEMSSTDLIDRLAPYDIALTIEGDATTLKDSVCYLAFDEPFTPYDIYRRKGFELDLKIGFAAPNATMVNYWQQIVPGYLYITGVYFSPPYLHDLPKNSMLGFCNNYYLGLGSQDAQYQSYVSVNECLIATTPLLENTISTASMFHQLRQEDWVLYIDKMSKRLTIRKGSLNFKEYPMKSEIAIGKPSLVERKSGGNGIDLNADQDRFHRVSYIPPEGDVKTYYWINIGENSSNDSGSQADVSSVYGALIGGKGKIDLQATRRNSDKPLKDAKFDGFPVAPVVGYCASKLLGSSTANTVNFLDVGVDTKEKKVNAVDVKGSKDSSLYDAVYVKNNQTMEDSRTGCFDVLDMGDGEIMVIYGWAMGPFKSSESGSQTEMKAQNVIMMIGTFNDDLFWKSPTKKSYVEGEDKALMVLNDVDYLCSIFNPLSRTVSVYAICYHANTEQATATIAGSAGIGVTKRVPFLGSFTFPIVSTTKTWKKYIETAEGGVDAVARRLYPPRTPTSGKEAVTTTTTTATSSKNDFEFLLRPPIISDAIAKNTAQSWSSKPIENNNSDKEVQDIFTRVIGPTMTKSLIEYKDTITFASVFEMNSNDGSYIMLFDTSKGIVPLVSLNAGLSWTKLNILLADGIGGFMIGESLFYITNSGIDMKPISKQDCLDLEKLAGKSDAALETLIQGNLNKKVAISLGTGPVPFQKMSGHISGDGIMKVFYYDSEGLLNSVSSSDQVTWKFADNF